LSIDLSIIIVNWNVRDMLRDCLKSLKAYHGTLQIEIIVVDSASSDGSIEMLRQEFPEVRVIAEAENIGFVRGNNLGLEAAQGRYLLLLNPDTRVHHHALAILAETLDANPHIGIVGPQTLNTDGTHQSTRRRFPTLWLSMIDNTALAERLQDHFYVREMPDDGVYEVDWVQGSALMARREVYAAIGGLDPTYFMFYEELDWCRRAKAAGWSVMYVGRSVITHYGGGSTSQVVTRKHVHYQHSKLHYFRKFHGLLAALFLRLALILNYTLQLLLESAKLLLKHKPELRQERIASYRIVLRSLIYAGERAIDTSS
jgi:N-acetylglucosaminyl-diphospho-decaprenol L-rhamnosyltransferase